MDKKSFSGKSDKLKNGSSSIYLINNKREEVMTEFHLVYNVKKAQGSKIPVKLTSHIGGGDIELKPHIHIAKETVVGGRVTVDEYENSLEVVSEFLLMRGGINYGLEPNKEVIPLVHILSEDSKLLWKNEQKKIMCPLRDNKTGSENLYTNYSDILNARKQLGENEFILTPFYFPSSMYKKESNGHEIALIVTKVKVYVFDTGYKTSEYEKNKGKKRKYISKILGIDKSLIETLNRECIQRSVGCGFNTINFIIIASQYNDLNELIKDIKSGLIQFRVMSEIDKIKSFSNNNSDKDHKISVRQIAIDENINDDFVCFNINGSKFAVSLDNKNEYVNLKNLINTLSCEELDEKDKIIIENLKKYIEFSDSIKKLNKKRIKIINEIAGETRQNFENYEQFEEEKNRIQNDFNGLSLQLSNKENEIKEIESKLGELKKQNLTLTKKTCDFEITNSTRRRAFRIVQNSTNNGKRQLKPAKIVKPTIKQINKTNLGNQSIRQNLQGLTDKKRLSQSSEITALGNKLWIMRQEYRQLSSNKTKIGNVFKYMKIVKMN